MKQAFVFMPYNPGDVVLALRLTQALHLGNPDLEIDFITSTECLSLTENIPWLRHRIALPRKELKACFLGLEEGAKAIPLLEEAIRPIAHLQYDLGANLFQGAWGAYLMPLLPCKSRMGLWPEYGADLKCHGEWCECWMAQPVDRQAMPIHCLDLWRKQAQALNFHLPSTPLPSHLWPPRTVAPSLRSQANHQTMDLPPHGGSKDKIALHPGTAWSGKQWPISQWVELAQSLLQEGMEVWITGAPEEKELGQAFASLATGPKGQYLHNQIGKTSWQEMITLYQSMKWVVSGDTVAMHLASCTGPRVLALFGASNPRETGPYGPGHFVVETQKGPYPTNLDFKSPHPALSELTAPRVAHFLLTGSQLGSVSLWETHWHDSLQIQVLKDEKGASQDMGRISFWLNPSSPAWPSKARPMALARLKAALDAALENIQSSTLRELDEAEKAWAEITDESFIWEAYRIAIHGISHLDLRKHLELRHRRLAEAIAKWEHFSALLIAEAPLQKAQ
jgi:ADP-heptose:LPS heptosyltransferase